jgi:hypothetical protein
MGFEEIFDICQEIPVITADLQDIGAVVTPVDETREQVLEAHKLLMQLNPDNCEEFTDLISALESGR